MAQNVHLMMIDPQNDFMDTPEAALAVPGATEDMKRAAAMIDRIGDKLRDIHVTLDSHHLVDVGHPAMWVGADGKTPPPAFTPILSDDIRTGVWTPRRPNGRPEDLGGETVREYMIRYASTLENQGQHLLMVWATHCLIGSPGHNVQPDVMAALNRWAGPKFANINFVTKGTNPWTEHYGALQAEVPLASDPSTGLNTPVLEVLEEADMLIVLGEAWSHCLRSSVSQIADNIDERLIRKIWLVTDCTSSIPAVPGGPDFPAMSQKWQDEMEARGMNVTTSTEILA